MIERDRTRCNYLAAQLPTSTLILHGDSTDEALLAEERRHSHAPDAIAASFELLQRTLARNGEPQPERAVVADGQPEAGKCSGNKAVTQTAHRRERR